MDQRMNTTPYVSLLQEKLFESLCDIHGNQEKAYFFNEITYNLTWHSYPKTSSDRRISDFSTGLLKALISK